MAITWSQLAWSIGWSKVDAVGDKQVAGDTKFN
jgi:hypothetical protein